MTVTGQVKTLTITPVAPPAPTSLPEKHEHGSFFSSSGKVTGVFVSVAIIIVVVSGLLIAFFLHRKRKAERLVVTSNNGDNTPQRRPSRLSQMGLVSGSQRGTGDRGVPSIQTSNWDPVNSGEKSPSDTTTPLDLRSSYPRIVDQRLDPVALWNPLHDNGSHISVRSFQDDQDYSRRMLRVGSDDLSSVILTHS